jgi:hypothetical protein
MPQRMTIIAGRTRQNDRCRPGRHIASVMAAASPGASQGLPRAVVLPSPAGCPSRLFCGSGAAVRIFGWPASELRLAGFVVIDPH